MNTIVGKKGQQFDKIISAVNKYLLLRNELYILRIPKYLNKFN